MQANIRSEILRALEIEPTVDQMKAIELLSIFLSHGDEQGIFILRGFAGTGKTTLLAALTRVLKKFILLAPTGRAAKVLSGYSGCTASTIHRHIYKVMSDGDGRLQLTKMENKRTSTVFIVDEASMIGNSSEDMGNGLLEDLIDYVSMGKKCRMILVGDVAQLPPVHSDYSPALDIEQVRSISHHDVIQTELKHVVRQKEAGGILLNATALRILISRQADKPILKTIGFTDITQLPGMEFKEELESCYSKYGRDEVLIITRSNKSANQYNQLIRNQLLWMDDELGSGDRLMVVKNNYYWLEKESKAGFIANGDNIEVQRLFSVEEKFGFRFAKAQLKMVDYPDEPSFEAHLLLDTLYSVSPALTREENNKLYNAVVEQYIHESKTARRKLVREDPYLNALQVKFSYAVTCHKAQGGQWKAVFVDQGYMTDEMQGVGHLRWLYTAFTRATEKLYLMNFDESLFKT